MVAMLILLIPGIIIFLLFAGLVGSLEGQTISNGASVTFGIFIAL